MKRRSRGRNISIAGVLLAAVLAAAQWLKTNPDVPKEQGPLQKGVFHVERVYDGDTIRLNNGERVRLIGIDTPESHDNQKLSRDVKKHNVRKDTQLAMGEEAARYVSSFLNGKEVRLEFDVQPRDRYQRTLAYVYLTDGTFVNKKIICDGYAYPMTIPPNVRHADEFKACFDEAREQRRGLWK